MVVCVCAKAALGRLFSCPACCGAGPSAAHTAHHQSFECFRAPALGACAQAALYSIAITSTAAGAAPPQSPAGLALWHRFGTASPLHAHGQRLPPCPQGNPWVFSALERLQSAQIAHIFRAATTSPYLIRRRAGTTKPSRAGRACTAGWCRGPACRPPLFPASHHPCKPTTPSKAFACSAWR